jgi:hypothetical protein
MLLAVSLIGGRRFRENPHQPMVQRRRQIIPKTHRNQGLRLESLRIRPEDLVELTTDGKTMTISPASESGRKARVGAARKRLNARHKEAFKRLAE